MALEDFGMKDREKIVGKRYSEVKGEGIVAREGFHSMSELITIELNNTLLRQT